MFSARDTLKPGDSALTLYRPKMINGTRYVPLGPVRTVLATFVSMLRTVTRTPGMTAPVLSRISPLMDPVISWECNEITPHARRTQ